MENVSIVSIPKKTSVSGSGFDDGLNVTGNANWREPRLPGHPAEGAETGAWRGGRETSGSPQRHQYRTHRVRALWRRHRVYNYDHFMVYHLHDQESEGEVQCTITSSFFQLQVFQHVIFPISYTSYIFLPKTTRGMHSNGCCKTIERIRSPDCVQSDAVVLCLLLSRVIIH